MWLFGTIITFQLERDVFLREQANKLYYPSAYWVSKNMVEAPVALFAPLLTLLVVYWLVYYSHFFMMYLAMMLVAQTSQGMGLFISTMAPNMPTATALAPLYNIPVLLFGGLFVNTDTLPEWLAWIQWVSPVRFANEAISHSQYDDYEGYESASGKIVNLPAGFMQVEGFTIGYWNCIAVLIGMMIIWRALSLCMLKMQIKKV